MKLRGYETRMLFRRYGIPIPEDWILDSTEDTPPINIHQELYVAIAINRNLGCPLLMTLYEENKSLDTLRSQNHPIVYETINPILGLHAYQAHRHASEINIPREIWQAFVDIALRLYQCYEASDAELLAVDPLVITDDNRLLAMNGRALIDDNALFRQSDLAMMGSVEPETATEERAREAGMPALSLGGEIACIVNGVGMAMTIVDLIQQFGASEGIFAAHIIDIENNNSTPHIADAIGIALEDVHVKTILINVFGGLTRCDEVARGILQAYTQTVSSIPLILRLEGTKAHEARQLIEAAALPNIRVVATLAGAVRLAIASVKGL